MLLQHPWLASLSKPAVISEEDDEISDDDNNGSPSTSPDAASNGTAPAAAAADANDPAYDDEVAQWVKSALERKASGQMGMSAKPALHAAPLDSVSPSAV